MSDTLSVTLPEPLATKVRVAAEACGLSPNEWAEMVLTRSMEAEQRTARIELKSDTDDI
jgi:predicted HicB family RNase H-like nuclease